jgi:HD-GYP domain-containing protein (c-di-GMP phosphodiesterase class II)
MSEPIRILCVFGDPEVLQSVEGLFPDRRYEVLTAVSGQEAISLLSRSGPVQVVLAGYGIRETEGGEYLGEVRSRWPDAVRIGLTRDVDPAAAASAVGGGRVYKFLTWPSDGEEARAVVDSALDRFRLVRALRGGDEAVLHSTAQEVELRDPYTQGHCDRVATYALSIASVLGLPEGTRRDLRYGSWLHDCGKIGVPETILNHPGKLSPEQFAIVRNHPVWGAEVARLAWLRPEVADILLHHHERFDGHGYPAGAKGREIPLGARIVGVADVFDAVSTDRPYAMGYDREEAIRVVGVLRGAALDPELVDALFASFPEDGGIAP